MIQTTLQARPYQIEAIAAVEGGLARSINRPLVALPTGTGKTIIFSHLIARRSGLGRSLIIAHREELLTQAQAKVGMVCPHLSTGLIQAETNQLDRDVLIASIQTLCRSSRLKQLPNDIETIIVDECHHAAADTYQEVLEHLRSFHPSNPPLTLGVSATPERLDKKALDKTFQEIVYQKNILEMIRQGYLSDLRAQQVRLPINFNKLAVRNGDFAERELSEAMMEAKAPKLIAEAVKQYASTRNTIIFTPNVELAHQIAAACQQLGISAAAIDGSQDSQTRKSLLQQYANGSLSVLVNCNLLTEGYDEPKTDCIVMARPTKSKGLYAQAVGRGTRLHPDKQDCLIIDLVGATTSFDLMSMGKAFGLSDEKLQGVSLLGFVIEQEQAEIAHRSATARLMDKNRFLETKAVDLFNRSALNWLKANNRRYMLSFGQATIFIDRHDLADKWIVYVKAKNTEQLLAKDVSLSFAMGIAEDHIRNQNLGQLLSRDAQWRQKPASSKQIETMRKIRIPIKPSLTMGEASDLISLHFGRQAS